MRHFNTEWDLKKSMTSNLQEELETEKEAEW